MPSVRDAADSTMSAVAGFMATRTGGRSPGSCLVATLGALAPLLAAMPAMLEASSDPAEEQVIDLTGDAAHHRRLERTVRRVSGRATTLTTPDLALIEAYRWAGGDPARAACADKRRLLLDAIALEQWVVVPLGRSVLFETLVTQAEEQVAFLDLDGVFDTIEQARAWVVCEPDVVDSDQVARLFLAQALAHVYRNDGTGAAAFQQLLAVAPDFRLPGEVRTPDVEGALAAARAAQDRAGRVTVAVQPAQGLLFLDGRPATRLEVPPGSHIVQLKAPHGEVRTRWIDLPAKDGTGQATAAPDFGLLAREQAYRKLVRDVSSGQLGSKSAAILDAHLARCGLGVLLLATLDPRSGAPVLWRYSRAGLEAFRRGEAPPGVASSGLGGMGENSRRREGGWRISVGAGVQGVLGGEVNFVASAREAGYVLAVVREGRTLDIEVRGTFLPHIRESSSNAGDCLSAEAGQPVVLDVPAAVACLASKPVFGLSVGVSHGWSLTGRIRAEPGAFLEAMRLPNVVIILGKTDAPVPFVGDAIMAGGAVRVRLLYALSSSRRSPEIGLSGSFGLLVAGASGEAVLAPLAAATAIARFAF